MSNTSTNSESSELISTCLTDDCTKSFTHLRERYFRCCPNCGYSNLRFRHRSNTYVCLHCGEIFSTPIIPPTKSRNCCPHCESVSITRRHALKTYLCNKCGNVFTVPGTKSIRVGGPHAGRKLAVSTYRSAASKTTEAV